jgi:hypothetical protein
MATTTLGTVSTSTLTAIQWQPAGVSASDLTAIRNAILNDKIIGLPNPIYPGALEDGKLYVPNRGVLTILPGDWIGVDQNGFPYLIPGTYVPVASGMSTTGITQSGSAVISSLATNAVSLGWVAGMFVGGSNVSSGAQIQSISPGGSSVVLTSTVAASSAAATISVGGGWTHP